MLEQKLQPLKFSGFLIKQRFVVSKQIAIIVNKAAHQENL
jgi:hypothetical protein